MLTGGPGTGKSRTVAAVVALAAGCGLPAGRWPPRPAGPPNGWPTWPVRPRRPCTGCSARRRHGPGSWVFTRNEEWPLDADLVVVDEASMLDAELAAALVEACPDGARLLLSATRPSCPRSARARCSADLIDSGAVPVTELTRLYRQRAGGVIARLATAVRGGTLPPVDSPDREVVVLPVPGSAERRATG